LRKTTIGFFILLSLALSIMHIPNILAQGKTLTFDAPGPYGAWEDGQNWKDPQGNRGVVPTKDDDAIIAPGETADVTKSEQKTVKSLKVETGATVGPVEQPADTNIKTQGGDMTINGQVSGGTVSLDSGGKAVVAGSVTSTDGTTIKGKAPAGQVAVEISGTVTGETPPVGVPGPNVQIVSDGDVKVSGKAKAGDARASTAEGEPAPKGGDVTINTAGTGSVTIEQGGEVAGGNGGVGLGVDGGDGGNPQIDVGTKADGKEIKGKDKVKGGKGGNTNDPTKKKGTDGKPDLRGSKISFVPPTGGIIGGYVSLFAYDLIEFSYLYQGAINSSDLISINTGYEGIIDLRGNPAGVNVLIATTGIYLTSNNVFLDPGVSIADITEPDAIISPVGGVGGFVVPVDKFGLLAPCIGLSSILVATAATAIYVKRVKRRKEKQ
jgi:hypothetical protein